MLNLISFQGQAQGHHRCSSIGCLWRIFTCTLCPYAIFQEVKIRFMLRDMPNLIRFQGQAQGHHRCSSIVHLWRILVAPQIFVLFFSHFGCLWCTLIAPQVLVLYFYISKHSKVLGVGFMPDFLQLFSRPLR